MHKAILAAAAASACFAAAPSAAAVYTDDLAKCLVAKTSQTDRTDLMRWFFAVMSANPSVNDLVQMSQPQRREHTLRAGRLFQRLMTDDCHTEAVAAIKYDGPRAIESSFEVLGKVAVMGLMSDPSVNKEMEALSEGANMEKMNALLREAGVATPDKPK